MKYTLPVIIQKLLPLDYHGSLDYLDIALFSAFLFIIFLIFSNILMAKKLTKRLSLISFLISIMHLTISMLAIGKYGIIGVFYSALITYLVGISVVMLILRYESHFDKTKST